MFLIIKLQILLNIIFTFTAMIIFPYLMHTNKYKHFYMLNALGHNLNLELPNMKDKCLGSSQLHGPHSTWIENHDETRMQRKWEPKCKWKLVGVGKSMQRGGISTYKYFNTVTCYTLFYGNQHVQLHQFLLAIWCITVMKHTCGQAGKAYFLNTMSVASEGFG